MSPKPHLTATQQARVDALLQPFTQRQGPGLSWGVLKAGELLAEGGAGLASLEHGVPITARTRFRIASVSKHFTVAAVLRLQAQGRLSLADDVRQLLPELAAWPRAISIEQLMRNTSGLPDFLELLRLGGVGLEQRVDRGTMLAAITRNRHLNFAPGSRFLYSNSNFLLLGLLVERLGGQDLAEHLQDQFFAPLGLQDTQLELPCDGVLPGLAAPYLPDGAGGFRRALHGFEHGGEGGLVSSVGDLLRWAGLMLAPPPELAALVQALQDATRLSGGQPSPYARGLEHSVWLGRDCWGHGGLWPGYKTEFLLMPAEALAVVVISNDGGANPYKLARELACIVLDAPAPARADKPPLGPWFNAEAGQWLDLYEQDGALMARHWGVSFELRQTEDGSWLPWRGAYEFRLRALDEAHLRLELGAGEVLICQRLHARAPLPADLPGSYDCPDIATRWRIDANAQLWIEGPLTTPPLPWRLLGLGEDCVELQSQGYWMQPSQLLRIERAADGRISGLRLDGARVKQLPWRPVSL